MGVEHWTERADEGLVLRLYVIDHHRCSAAADPQRDCYCAFQRRWFAHQGCQDKRRQHLTTHRDGSRRTAEKIRHIDRHDLIDKPNRQRKQLRSRLHQQHLVDRRRNRQGDLHGRALTVTRVDGDGAVQGSNVSGDHVHAHTAPRQTRHCLMRSETGSEDQREELFTTPRLSWGNKTESATARRNGLEVDTRTIVREGETQRPVSQCCDDADRAGRWFTTRLPRCW